MSKSKSSLIRTMRTVATSPHAYDDLPALLALSASLDFLHRHFSNSNSSINFIQIICRPSHFHLSFDKLAFICYYSEKTIRRKCKFYVKYFYAEYSYFQNLPLPLLVARLSEYRSDNFLRNNIPSLRTITLNDITAGIFSCNATQGDKQLSLSIIAHFENLNESSAHMSENN